MICCQKVRAYRIPEPSSALLSSSQPLFVFVSAHACSTAARSFSRVNLFRMNSAQWIGVFRHTPQLSASVKFVAKVLALAILLAFLVTILWWADSYS